MKIKSLFLSACLIPGLAIAQETSETETIPVVGNWQICNETSFSLRIATAFMQGEKPAAKGWKSLRSGSCLETEILVGAAKYVYAESSKAHRGGIREWRGEIPLCTVDAENFAADPDIGCALQNMTTRNFMAIDPMEPITSLVEIENFVSKASTAGIQRLLRDNGYDITRVDGIAGRRTSKTLSKFLKDNELPASLTTEEQLDALEQAAKEKVKSIGLTLCNRSESDIWSAIGLRRKGNWESRGWWKIEAENCTQVYTGSLLTADLSYYASQDGGLDEEGEKLSDKSIRVTAAAPSQFCISDSKFAVLGRESCIDNGYKAANFRVLPADKEGLTIDLTDADFAEVSASGLR